MIHVVDLSCCTSAAPRTHELEHHKLNVVSGNVAYHKTATQSSDPATTWSEDYPADKAVDGKTDPHIENGHCAHPDEKWGQHARWTVDLEETFYIYYVIIYNRDTGMCCLTY